MNKKYTFTDEKGFYSQEIDGVEGEFPPLGAILSPPPPEPWDHVWPRWDGTTWELVPDHRKRDYDRVQAATDYWLPGDRWDSPARTMAEIGPLPDGAMLTAPERDPMEALAAAQESALSRIDAMAEAERAKYITPGSGQALVYQRKLVEAGAALSGDAGPFPHLEAEIGVTAPTLEAVARSILSMEENWVQISAALEGVRLTTKVLVRNSTNVDGIKQVMDSLHWPNF